MRSSSVAQRRKALLHLLGLFGVSKKGETCGAAVTPPSVTNTRSGIGVGVEQLLPPSPIRRGINSSLMIISAFVEQQ